VIKLNVLITGDIHGEFARLNDLINTKKHQLDLIICCGDFGYWPNHDRDLQNIKTHGKPLLWCEGNHEDHWALRDRKTDELAPNVFYMPRGSTYKLDDGRTIMFMGGADSIDKEQRVIGYSWFPEEIIAQKDLMNLPDIRVDIFVTHTCPTELYPVMVQYYDGKQMEPSNYALSELWKKYKPDLWFFGHWHHFKAGTLENTKWYALNHATSRSPWWMWLSEA
jgi:predicted phosphodiesterase